MSEYNIVKGSCGQNESFLYPSIFCTFGPKSCVWIRSTHLREDFILPAVTARIKVNLQKFKLCEMTNPSIRVDISMTQLGRLTLVSKQIRNCRMPCVHACTVMLTIIKILSDEAMKIYGKVSITWLFIYTSICKWRSIRVIRSNLSTLVI